LAARVRFALDQMRPARVGLMSTAHEQISAAKRRGRRPLLGSIDHYTYRDRHCCPNTVKQHITANRHYNRGDFSDRCRFGRDGGAEIHSLASAKNSALGET
jgi:hypothetical protein